MLEHQLLSYEARLQLLTVEREQATRALEHQDAAFKLLGELLAEHNAELGNELQTTVRQLDAVRAERDTRR